MTISLSSRKKVFYFGIIEILKMSRNKFICIFNKHKLSWRKIPTIKLECLESQWFFFKDAHAI